MKAQDEARRHTRQHAIKKEMAEIKRERGLVSERTLGETRDWRTDRTRSRGRK